MTDGDGTEAADGPAPFGYFLDADSERRRRTRPIPEAPERASSLLISGPVAAGRPTEWLGYKVLSPTELEFSFFGCLPRFAAVEVFVEETVDTVTVGLVLGRRPETADREIILPAVGLLTRVQLNSPLDNRRVVDANDSLRNAVS